MIDATRVEQLDVVLSESAQLLLIDSLTDLHTCSPDHQQHRLVNILVSHGEYSCSCTNTFMY